MAHLYRMRAQLHLHWFDWWALFFIFFFPARWRLHVFYVRVCLPCIQDTLAESIAICRCVCVQFDLYLENRDMRYRYKLLHFAFCNFPQRCSKFNIWSACKLYCVLYTITRWYYDVVIRWNAPTIRRIFQYNWIFVVSQAENHSWTKVFDIMVTNEKTREWCLVLGAWCLVLWIWIIDATHIVTKGIVVRVRKQRDRFYWWLNSYTSLNEKDP